MNPGSHRLSAKNLLFAITVCLLVLPGRAQQLPVADTELQKIKTPPLPEFHPQIPKRVVLPNGMVVLLQEDHELPLIEGTMRIRGGSRQEPASKVGLVDIYGDVWRTGGTKDKTGDQLDDFLEARAAKVETDGNRFHADQLQLPETGF